jgi:hypothetical protein
MFLLAACAGGAFMIISEILDKASDRTAHLDRRIFPGIQH